MFKPVGTFSNLSISKLSTSDFNLAKSILLASFDVSTPVAFLNLLLLHYYINLIELSLFLLKISVLENIHSLILCLFYKSNY